MRVAVFSTQSYEETVLREFNKTFQHELVFYKEALTEATASLIPVGFTAVSAFVGDEVNATVIKAISQHGIKLIVLRCAGYDSVDLKAAAAHDITVMRTPAYSPHAIAEYTVGMLLALDRKIPSAWQRVCSGNFDLNGLTGHNLRGKTVGIIGTGRIGAAVATTMQLGFGCHVLAHDIYPRPDLQAIGVQYVDRDTVFRKSDILCLHCPLTPESRHLINAETLSLMKPGVVIVNTSRGALIDTPALIDALEVGRIGGCALDVYEGEHDLFFRASTLEVIRDNAFKRLIKLPNVLMTGHQAFLTKEAVNTIAETTLMNMKNFEAGKTDANVVIGEA